MDHRTAIDRITDALHPHDAVRALFLSGSFGTGLADDYSDIDMTLVTTDGATDATAALCRAAIEQVGPIVMWRDRVVRPALINAITETWHRIDFVLLKPDQVASHRRDSVKPLIDRIGLFDTLAAETPAARPQASALAYQFDEFIRIFGLLPLVLGRQEYINGVAGVFHLRNLLVDLMITETGVKFRGGALHVNRLLTEAQKDVMLSLPPPDATRDSLIAAHLAYAEAYLPRARGLAAKWGIDWPSAFENATWVHIESALDIIRPDWATAV